MSPDACYNDLPSSAAARGVSHAMEHKINDGGGGELCHPDIAPPLPPKQNTLTETEQQELTRLERHLHLCLSTFVTVGLALRRILEGRLYRANHATFEDYLWTRWHFSASRAFRLITAAALMDQITTMLPMGNITLPKNERAVRPLARLRIEDQAKALVRANEIAEGAEITSSHVEQALLDLDLKKVEKTRATKKHKSARALLAAIEGAVSADAPKAEVIQLIQELRRSIGPMNRKAPRAGKSR